MSQLQIKEMIKKTLKILMAFIALMLLSLYLVGLWKLRSQTLEKSSLTIMQSALSLEDGLTVAARFGCTSCHGEALSGGKVWPIPSLIATVEPPALAGRTITDEQWVKAVRHGLDHENQPLLFMPSTAYQQISDQELSAIIQWSRNQKVSTTNENQTQLGLLGPIMVGIGMLELSTDHIEKNSRKSQVQPAANREYGAVLAQVCAQCHGSEFAGRPLDSQGPPAGPDIRGSSLLNEKHGWNKDNFSAFFKSGTKPDGTKVSQLMPWQALGVGYQDTQIDALWKYLSSL
ncbi:MAG: c-type cytochrome [Xanthomonadales bacterium]|nr:c-type cytochrome [Xanthomonadales bacterium]